jgi:transcriptional regulator with XRE-family HTH domain
MAKARRRKPPESLSDQLRELARDARPSLYELAREAGVDRSVLSRFVAGKRTITLETADRLAAILKLRLIAGRRGSPRRRSSSNRRQARGAAPAARRTVPWLMSQLRPCGPPSPWRRWHTGTRCLCYQPMTSSPSTHALRH